MRALDGMGLEEIEQTTLVDLLKKLENGSRDRRYGLGLILKGLGRRWDIKCNAKRKTPHESVPMTNYTINEEQKILLQSLVDGKLSKKGVRNVQMTIAILNVSALPDLVSFPEEEAVAKCEGFEHRLQALRFTMRFLGRPETFGVEKQRKKMKVGSETVELSVSETDWLNKLPDEEKVSYTDLKLKYTNFLVTEYGDTKRFNRDEVDRGLRVFRLLPCEARKNITLSTIEMWTKAVIECVCNGIKGSSSLQSHKRQSRTGEHSKSNIPGHSLAGTYVTSVKRIQRFFKLPESLIPSKNAIQKSVLRLFPLNGVALAPFNDVLNASDIERVINAAKSKKERLIAVLMGRLGMRIGAARKLRMSGLVENLVPNEKWTIRRFISGIDKNDQINKWDTHFDKSVNDALYTYIEDEWRPKYEEWVKSNNGDSQLRTLWLFQRKWSAGWPDEPMCYSAMASITKNLLGRAGIKGFHAHPHAFRKGVVTTLLRNGNTLHAVSRYVHHKSTTVTERSYDKRTYEEVVDKMQVPLEWERNNEEGADQCQDQNEVGSRSHHSGETSSANRLAAQALMNEMDTNERLRKENELLLSLISPDKLEFFRAELARITE